MAATAVTPEQIDEVISFLVSSRVTYAEAVRDFKRRYIYRALVDHNGNQCRAARALGIHRNSLSRLMVELVVKNPYDRLRRLRKPVTSVTHYRQR